MADTYKSKYGLDWHPEMSDVHIELSCAKKFRESPYTEGSLLDPWEHMLRAMRALFPKECDCPLVISPWTEEHAHDWCMFDFCITWGCAASSKSNDYGAMAMLDWSVDPHQTYTVLASTGKDMLQVRSFESVVRYFSYLKSLRIGWPGKQSKQRLAIINESDGDYDDEGNASVKAAIKGVAVAEGTDAQARAKLQGGHLPYVRQIGDELSQMRRAFMDVRSNMRAGAGKDYKFVGLCNPDSFTDLAAEFSVPSGGWSKITADSVLWETPYGHVRHHNGFHSPAIADPKGFPHLINQTQIDDMIKDCGGNPDHPMIWTMVKGFPPPQGITQTVITAKMVQTYRMQDLVTWRGAFQRGAFLDAAYTDGGDECVLQPFEVGWSSEDILTLHFSEPHILVIKADTDELVIDQIARQVKDLQAVLQFSDTLLGVEDSSIQNIGDIIAKAISPRIYRFKATARASELPVSAFDPTPAKERYYDGVTEAMYSLRTFGEYGQIRGLDTKAADDICNRRIQDNRRPFRVEAKKDFKKRMRKSPDRGDCAIGVVDLCRRRLGFFPGARIFDPRSDVNADGSMKNLAAGGFTDAQIKNMDETNAPAYDRPDYGG
jgi:hypothetical protein